LLKRNEYFDIKRARASQGNGRVLIVVSKKVGNAVKRNLIRRRLKHIMLDLNVHEGSFDYAIFTKPKIPALTFAQLQQLVSKILCD
jgi:ribonuclease P protein component